jgi:hypothetical protein
MIRYLVIGLLGALGILAGVGVAQAQISVRSDLSQDLTLAPGQSQSGEIRVHNESNEPQQARIYQTDYRFQADGSNTYGEPGSIPRSNAGWIQFTPPTLTIPPQATRTFAYTVTVPRTLAGDTLASSQAPQGSYWSMLMVEPITERSPLSTLPADSLEKGQMQMGFRQVTRYGVQVATHVNGGTPEVRLKNVELARGREGGKQLLVDIGNVGTAMIQPDVWAEVYGADGTEVGRFTGQEYRIYPGTSVRQRLDLSTLPAGTYQALVVVDAEGRSPVGAQYKLEL